jgi:transposase
MVYQGLGFGDGRLYFAKDFFSNKPMDVLFRKGIKSAMFNDDVLGAALDAITDYGPTRFFTNIAFHTLIANNLVSRFAHLDSTTHSFHGRKYKSAGKVKVNFGHSKGRADLPQVLQFLMTTESGLPFWTAVRSGNLSDRELFPAAITSIQNHIKNIKQDLSVGFVADSALYSKKFLLNKNITSDWITRVPESIKLAKNLVERDHSQVSWHKLNEDYIGRNANIERCFRVMKDALAAMP